MNSLCTKVKKHIKKFEEMYTKKARKYDKNLKEAQYKDIKIALERT